MRDVELADVRVPGHSGESPKVLFQETAVQVRSQGVAAGGALPQGGREQRRVGAENVGDAVPGGRAQRLRGPVRRLIAPQAAEALHDVVVQWAAGRFDDSLQRAEGRPPAGLLPAQDVPHPVLLVTAHRGPPVLVIAPGLRRYSGPLGGLLDGQAELDAPIAHRLGDVGVGGLVVRQFGALVVRAAHPRSSHMLLECPSDGDRSAGRHPP